MLPHLEQIVREAEAWERHQVSRQGLPEEVLLGMARALAEACRVLALCRFERRDLSGALDALRAAVAAIPGAEIRVEKELMGPPVGIRGRR